MASLTPFCGTLVCRSTPVGNHCVRPYCWSSLQVRNWIWYSKMSMNWNFVSCLPIRDPVCKNLWISNPQSLYRVCQGPLKDPRFIKVKVEHYLLFMVSPPKISFTVRGIKYISLHLLTDFYLIQPSSKKIICFDFGKQNSVLPIVLYVPWKDLSIATYIKIAEKRVLVNVHQQMKYNMSKAR